MKTAIVSVANLKSIDRWDPDFLVPASNGNLIEPYMGMNKDELLEAFDSHPMMRKEGEDIGLDIPKNISHVYKMRVFKGSSFREFILSSLRRGNPEQKLRVALIFMDLIKLSIKNSLGEKEDEIKTKIHNLEKELESLRYLKNN